MKKNILIVRGFANEINITNYNSQEIGLAKALIKQGYQCDIVYYTKSKKAWIQKLDIDNCQVNIYWYPAIKIFNNAIYIQMMRDKIIDNYDIIQTNEYNQFMTWYLCKTKKKPIVLYNGIYQDSRSIFARIINNKIPELLFKKAILKNIDIAVGKSKLAEEYLKNKGFKNTKTVGVGLDIEKLNKKEIGSNDIDKIIDDLKIKLKDNKVLLYIGRLNDKAKNIRFLIDILAEIVKVRPNYKLLLVGKSYINTIQEHLDYAKEKGIGNNVIHINGIPQTYLKAIYDISDIFVLPSKYEIFGMVIMESMYFKTPVITSINGGSTTVIDHNETGIIVEDFNVKIWSESIIKLIENRELYNNIIINAYETITTKFIWEELAKEFIKIYKKLNVDNKSKI